MSASDQPKRYRLGGTKFEFSPGGGPIDDHANHADLFNAIGLVTSAWARMENLLTALVLHVNKEAASKAIHEPDPSNAFSRKSKLLQAWITKHPPHSRLRTGKDASFFGQLRELADKRNAIAHGHLECFDRATTIATFKLICRIGKDTWEPRTYKIPMNDFAIIASLCNTANRYFISLADELFEGIEDAQPEKP